MEPLDIYLTALSLTEASMKDFSMITADDSDIDPKPEEHKTAESAWDPSAAGEGDVGVGTNTAMCKR